MKKVMYALILVLVIVSGVVFANREINNESSKKWPLKPLSAAEMKAEREKWLATPDGIKFKKWEASPAGKKVYVAEAKIRKHIKDSTSMAAVVTALSLPPGSRLGFGVMVKINDDDYILSFGTEKPDIFFLNFNNEFEPLHSLKVADKIIFKSHSVSHAPKYAYPIIAGDYIERDGKIIYKRTLRKGGC